MAKLASHFTSTSTSDLTNLIEHRLSVSSTMTVSKVYEVFQHQSHEFLAVMENNKFVGVVSRGQVGFLLGARFGFAVYERQPIAEHLLKQHLCIRPGTSLLKVFEAALSREGDFFYDDIALVDDAENFLGMVSVQTLVRLQSQMIMEQIQLAEEQQRELQDKNQQLFRNIHELRQSHGRYEILFENSALGVALIDRHGEIDTCNRRLQCLLGISTLSDQTDRISLADLVSASDRVRFMKLLGQLEMLPAAMAPETGEFTLSLPDRGPRLCKFFLNWIQETGQICALLDDITEQRVLERRMQQREKAALLESLVGGIAHEINNKLSPIVGYAELLSSQVRRLQHTSDLENYCVIIRESALESAKIIRQLLQLSRPHKVEMIRCDMKQILQDAVDLLRFRLRSVGCQVTTSLPEDQCVFMADPTQIKQVVMNLILNSADALEGRPIRRLDLQVISSNQYLHLVVSDTGGGIKPECLGRIFDPFFTTKSPDRGSGLGLSVCYSIIKQHSGEISVDSTWGEGTTFKITFPRGEVLSVAPTAQPQTFSASSQGLRLNRVLIADDEEFVTGLVHEALKLKLGCQVDKACDGDEAVSRIRENKYDLIISDVRMPTLDGFGLLDWIRTNEPLLVSHFMFITGDAGSSELNEALENSDVTVLRKPFDIEALVEVCRRTIKTPAVLPDLNQIEKHIQ
jgi:signal transduction histidine kinase/ActR/RegA family two-component response regulator